MKIIAICLSCLLAAVLFAQEQEKTIAVTTNSSKVSYFWELYYEGISKAAQEMKVKPLYYGLYDPDDSHMPKNIMDAIKKKPQSLILSIPDAALLEKPIRETLAMNIPIIATYAGYEDFVKLGIQHFVGEDSFQAGVQVGRRLLDAGVKNLLCVRDVEVDISLTRRVAGIKDAFDKENRSVKTIMIRGFSSVTGAATISTQLAIDDQIDAVLAIGSTAGNLAINALKEQERYGKIKFAAFDMTPEVKKALLSGNLLFVATQQPFAQGYLAMRIAAAPHTPIHEHLKALRRLFPTHDFTNSITVKNIPHSDAIFVETGPLFITRDMVSDEPNFLW